MAASVSDARGQDALVLGAGGSRGLAHAGAIDGLAEKGYRAELVVGTSIGAIIGALHAAGLSPDSIWKLARGIDWQEIFAYPLVRALPDGGPVRPFLNLGIGVNRDRYSEGLIADRGVNRLLVRTLFDAAARARGDFDRLPIRFRAVASDLLTGDVIALGGGDLARAVRSSMAVPGVFAPVIREDGRYLVDGGMSDYLPVSTAYAAGAQRVVAVDVIRPPPDEPGSRNPFQVALRSFRLTLRNARPDGPDPAATIEPDIDPELSAAIFLRDATPLLDAGRRAVIEQFPDSLARPPTAARGIGSSEAPPAAFGNVRVEANDPALEGIVARAFRDLAGTPYDAGHVLDRLDRLYATGFFNGIWPHVAADGSLIVRADAQPPLLGSLSAGYDDDRGTRLHAGLRSRHGAAEISLTGRLGSRDSWGSVSVFRPLTGRPMIAPTTGVAYRESDVRVFENQRVVAETEVRRVGGWAGFRWSGRNGAGEAVAAFRIDRIRMDQGPEGMAQGFSLRLAGREPNARFVGATAVVEIERRWGEIDWSSAAVRGSVGFGDRLLVALVGDLAAASTDAPLDVMPALGFDGGIPGLRFGSWRGPARVVAGIDLAYPVFLEGFTRLRLRSGARAAHLDELDRAHWMSGAEAGLIWWTPFGRIALGIGANHDGDWRASFDIGPRF